MIIQRVIILELKVAKSFKEIEAGCDNALEQIKKQDYAAYWKNEIGLPQSHWL